MMPLLVLLCILGWALFVRQVDGKISLPLAWLATVASISCVLSLGGLAGELQPTSRVVFWGGWIAGAAAIAWIGRRKRWKELAADLLQPGIVLACILAPIVYWMAFSDAQVAGNDEFSHWARSVKAMLALQCLPTPNDGIMFIGYPPGIAVFQYFVCSNLWDTEATYYFAHFVFLTAPCVIFFHAWGWRQWHWVLLTLATLVGLLMALTYGFHSILIDQMVSLYAAAALLGGVQICRTTSQRLCLIPVVCVLPLAKLPVGLGMAWIVIGLLVVDTVIQHVFKEPEANEPATKECKAVGGFRDFLCGPLCKAMLVWLAMLATVSTVHWVWERHVATLGENDFVSTKKLSVKRVIDACLVKTGRDHQVVRAFEGATRHCALRQSTSVSLAWDYVTRHYPRYQPLVTGLTLRGWLVTFAIFAGAGCLLAPNRAIRWRIAVPAVLLLAGVVPFLFSMLATYICCFRDYDALGMGGFARYLDTYVLVLILFGWFSVAVYGTTRRVAARAAFGLCLGLAVYIGIVEFPYQWSGRLFPSSDSLPLRSQMASRVHFASQRVPLNQAIWFVHQNSNVFSTLLFGYEMCPRYTNSDGWSPGTSTCQGGLWANNWTAKDWGKALVHTGRVADGREAPFDYVFIHEADAQFWTHFADLFTQDRRPDDFLFRVEAVPTSPGVRLTPVR
jgi:hypothetical protein